MGKTELLLITFFTGPFGVHHFIRKDNAKGILYLLTGGLFGLGWLYDVIKIAITPAHVFENERELKRQELEQWDNQRREAIIQRQAEILADREQQQIQPVQQQPIQYQQPQQPQVIYVNTQNEGQARCRKCGSTSLMADKKGFGYGKATVGGLMLGPIGLLAGGLGAKKMKVVCMQCGYKYKI